MPKPIKAILKKKNFFSKNLILNFKSFLLKLVQRLRKIFEKLTKLEKVRRYANNTFFNICVCWVTKIDCSTANFW
jgi:hypothetical protein